jgi:D-alanyl-D-alanine carboxypeptidase
MQHTSGLVRYEFNPRFIADLQADPYRVYTPLEELRYLFGMDPPFAAGEGWDYSDTNYIVLAMILERILGTTAYDAIRARVIEPLDLDGTLPSSSPDLPGLAQGYAGPQNPFGGFDAVLVDGRFVLNPQFEWAGGGYASTAADLARLAAAWYEGRLFDSTLVRQAVDGVAAPMLGPGVRYGLGVIVRDTPLGLTWGHSGYFPGYLTEVRYYPRHRVAIAVQLNQNAPRRGPGAIVQSLAGALFGPGGP